MHQIFTWHPNHDPNANTNPTSQWTVNREFGIKINVKKMKVICISQKENNKSKYPLP